MQYLLTKEELDSLNGNAEVERRCEDFKFRLAKALVTELEKPMSPMISIPQHVRKVVLDAIDKANKIPPHA